MQVQQPTETHTSVLELVQSTWTMLLAVGVRVDSFTVHVAPPSTALMATQKMLE